MHPELRKEFLKSLTFTNNGNPFSGEIGKIKELEEKELLKVGTKVVVTDENSGMEYGGAVERSDGDSVFPYLVVIDNYHGTKKCPFYFFEDYTTNVPLTFRVAEETPKFKKGDKVRLKYKFYDEADFKNDERHIRKAIAKIKGDVWTIHAICSADCNRYSKQWRVCGENDCEYTIPVSLLELVEESKEIEPKVGMWAEITLYTGASPVGSIVKITAATKTGSGHYRINYTDADTTWWATIPTNAKLLPNHKPLRKWTDAEIMEAKSIVAECLYEVASGTSFVITPISDGEQILMAIRGKTYFSNCCESDEWNVWIGRMVAFSKATGRKLPSWIQKGGTK